MRKFFAYFVFCVFVSSTVFSQDSINIKQENNYLNSKFTSFDKFDTKLNINYDSTWCFHPFSINLYAGQWSPLGNLKNYYRPSFKLGASFGLMITDNLKIEYGLGPIFLNNNNSLDFLVNDSILSTDDTFGASLGGWITYSVYKDRNLYIDIISGVTWELIDTDIVNPDEDPDDKYDSTLSVSTYGISLGTDIWINKFGNHNVGIRILYNYAAYNRSDILISKIGGHSISVSLIYRFPKRKQIFRKYY